ncbi:hypothetical protein ACQBAT_10275 [Ornithinimicrobium sp. Y1847]|uniref:hypothetical protein n=1 Tax=unclassified Ornithinimicrobium TaxID=2615080 RepID=UPI003B67FD33
MRVYGGGAYPAYLIDAETLREELLSEEDTREWLAEVPDDPHATTFWRMLGELDRAVDVGQQQLDEREPGTADWAAAAVRLAHAHHWREEYAEAHELLSAAEEVFGASGEGGAADEQLLAFVWQHRAKVFFDEGRLAEARADASRALETRRRIGADEGAVASSEETLSRIEREL